ncbi:HNH endonuclease [Pleionea sediminis]|uniref:HNH endonuclease n=1 Tax=Pleionea sediminis TaxID=2569479 RepID=UPI001185AC02|nr:HNH endonuclease signature motif containing protein [Pleionea sediminis]
MPARAKRPCRYRLCKGLTIERHGFCSEHAEHARSWSNVHTQSASVRGYGYAWQKQRKRAIARDSALCQPCLREGRVTAFNSVDHITPKSAGGSDALSNLQCICKACHALKTQQESQRARN